MGLDDSATSWMWSYLSGRQQSCFVDSHLSSPLKLFSFGVPKGSIEGPLLWLCFTCDQPVVGQDLHPCVQVVDAHSPITSFIQEVQLEEQIHGNQLVINPDK